MSREVRIHKALAAACLLAGAAAAFAQGAALDVQALSAAAKFVVHSRVSKVEYRLSQAGPKGQAAVPYTLVTYDVVRPVRGSAGSASFTLRFIGGPDGRGRFLRASTVPVFQMGDEDILFVRDNGSNGCPLVSCGEGRFRVLRGAMYEGSGTPVQAIQANRIVAGGALAPEFSKFSYPAPAFDELLKNPGVKERIAQQGLSIAEARSRYQAEAPAMIEMAIVSGERAGDDTAGFGEGQAATDAARLQAAARAMPTDAFVAAVAGVQVAERKSGPAFESADPQAQIGTPAWRAVAPAAAPAPSAAPQRSAADLAEERSLPKDDPSLTRNKAR
ncbi:MAG TPA: hypothetical protein VLA16_21195 [Ideonella sp.]|nr:hypothetical protein [Ideonella sp.]